MDILDDHHPVWDVRSQHHRDVRASVAESYRALQHADMSRSPLIRILFRLRGLPTRALTLDEIAAFRFYTLEKRSDEAVALGVIGRFWTVRGHLQRFEPRDFAGFAEPGFAKASWGFAVEEIAGGCRLSTETRISATDAASLRRFKRYWRLVGPFSGLIRREVLKIVAHDAESPAGRHGAT